MALFGVVAGTLIATAGIIHLHHTKVGRTTLVIQIVVYLLLAILSFFGLIGAITRRRKFVAVYWAMLTVHVVLSIIAGIFALHSIFKNAPQNTAHCINGSENPKIISSCKKYETTFKAVMVCIVVVIWLIQIYGCIIVDNYTKQLADEEDAHFKEEVGRPTW
jgi:uncharacterized membrane protein YozB (DUF420 family)